MITDDNRDRWHEVEHQVQDWLDNTPDATTAQLVGVVMDEARRHAPLLEALEAPANEWRVMAEDMHRAWRGDRQAIPGAPLSSEDPANG